MTAHAGDAAVPAPPHSHRGRYLAVWIALLLLTGLTWGLSRSHVPGFAGVAIALGIAIVKGTLVALFFMHLWDRPGPSRLVLLSSLVFVALLIGLTLLDVSTRSPLALPPDADTAPEALRRTILEEEAAGRRSPPERLPRATP